jgi:hypothetical protein
MTGKVYTLTLSWYLLLLVLLVEYYFLCFF